MKRFLTISLAVLLVAVLFAGCSKPDAALVGTWQGTLALSKLFGEEAAGISELDMPATVTFSEDGTYTLSVDASKIAEQINALTQKMEAVGQNAQGAVEQAIGAAGLESEMLTQVLKWLFPQKSGDSEEGVQKTTTINGRFKTEEGKLYLSFVKFVGIYSDTYITYSLTDNTLTLEAPSGESSDLTEQLGKIFPITLQKAS